MKELNVVIGKTRMVLYPNNFTHDEHVILTKIIRSTPLDFAVNVQGNYVIDITYGRDSALCILAELSKEFRIVI